MKTLNLSILVILLFSACSKSKQEEKLKILIEQQTNSAFGKQKINEFKQWLEPKFLKESRDSIIKKHIKIKFHYDGILYNKKRDSLVFIYTLEMTTAKEHELNSLEIPAVLKNNQLEYTEDCNYGVFQKKKNFFEIKYDNHHRRIVIENAAKMFLDRNMSCFKDDFFKDLLKSDTIKNSRK